MTFQRPEATIGLEATIEEIEHYDEVRIHYRKKCRYCKCYLSKGTISILCLKCSKKRLGIS
jgi:hypothetical protein